MHGELERTRELLFAHGWNTTCYQIVNPGIHRWFSQDKQAVIGYVRNHRTRVVAGAPVCSAARLLDVIKEWEADSERVGDRVCYFGAEARLQALTDARHGYTKVVLGAQPTWSPASFLSRFEDDPSLRAQRSRSANKDVLVEEWDPERAEGDPALRVILGEWLATRGLPPMHFLVEPETLHHLEGRRVFVASRNSEPCAFLVLSPIPARRGWLTEQFVRGKQAPNGTVELLLVTAARRLLDEGAQFLTMGIVPLSAHGMAAGAGNPAWLGLLLKWARAHGRRFYNFEGLDWFKDKFHPDEWEPIYAISKEDRFSPKSLIAIAEAFTQMPPALALMRGLGRAAFIEWQRLWRVR